MSALPLELGVIFSRNQYHHAFLQERSQKYFQHELLEHIKPNNQFVVLGLKRARPKRRLRGGDVRAKKQS